LSNFLLSVDKNQIFSFGGGKNRKVFGKKTSVSAENATETLVCGKLPLSTAFLSGENHDVFPHIYVILAE
jgi:hypothetical protein